MQIANSGCVLTHDWPYQLSRPVRVCRVSALGVLWYMHAHYYAPARNNNDVTAGTEQQLVRGRWGGAGFEPASTLHRCVLA
jgi:hypothetical protein